MGFFFSTLEFTKQITFVLLSGNRFLKYNQFFLFQVSPVNVWYGTSLWGLISKVNFQGHYLVTVYSSSLKDGLILNQTFLPSVVL